MRRILLSGFALLFAVAALVRIARSLPAEAGLPAATRNPAPAGKSDPLVFVFIRVDPEQNLAVLRPMIAPDIGVQLDTGLPAGAGSHQLEKHAVLQCHASTREHDALIEGQISKFSEMLLDCGAHKFVVKAVDFSPQR